MKKRLMVLLLTFVMALSLIPGVAVASTSEFAIENGVLTKYSGNGGRVVIPEGVTKIDDYAFYECARITEVTIPNSVECIGKYAFYGCVNIAEIAIPASVESIGSCAFEETAWLSAQGEFVIVNGNLLRYQGGNTRVTIPDSVTTICGSAFAGCGVTSVIIPATVTEIGDYAFSDCANLSSVVIPKSVTRIGCDVFEGTRWLDEQWADVFVIINGILLKYMGEYADHAPATITIPSAVTSIAGGAFRYCDTLKNVTIPDTVTEIGDYAFAYCCGLTSAEIPGSVKIIGENAFYWCENMSDVTIGDGVKTIGARSFSGCPLTSLEIPDSVEVIGECAFGYCEKLTSLNFGEGVTELGNQAFYNCTRLTAVTFPVSLEKIGGQAFEFCDNLIEITIPATVTSIGSKAFHMCDNLQDVYYGGSEEEWNKADPMGRSWLTEGVTIHYAKAMASEESTTYTANPTNDALSVDGVSQTPMAYKINGANFFQLRDVAMLLKGTKAQFCVDYDNVKRAVSIQTGKAYVAIGTELQGTASGSAEAIVGNDAIYINDIFVQIEVYKINGANYFKIRDLGALLGFNVGWTSERGMFIESDKAYNPND